IDLLGAGLGALLVSLVLRQFREESSLLLLAALAFVVSISIVISHTRKRARLSLAALALGSALGLASLGLWNLSSDQLNIIRKKTLEKYPAAELLASRSSFVGRVDIIKRKPSSTSLKSLENGRTIDTIRNRPIEHYQIDPRLPHTLMKDPVILILGLSGDGITKTARFLGSKVYGVEVNAALVELMKGPMVPYNGNSYEGIEVAVQDGRSYVEQQSRSYDIITLMNAHFARGRTSGRAPCPEYLHTYEALRAYLGRLTERGFLIVEEPMSIPRREPPIWKLLVSMRQVLMDGGSRDPQQHFFVFQWKTSQNNYVQILLKKNPWSSQEVQQLKQWLHDVDHIKEIQSHRGHRMGPIVTAKTTLLYAPGEGFSNTYARILRGQMSQEFLRSRNLALTTDDRPFPFAVDPQRPELKKASARTSLLLLLVLPFFVTFLTRFRGSVASAVPYSLVAALTGLAYFLVEMVLIQRFEIFLGSPVITFSVVLGTLLLGSGMGSLWSRNLSGRGLYGSLLIVVLLLGVHLWGTPLLLNPALRVPLFMRVLLAVASLAPLAFFMGTPLPTVLRLGKARFTPSGAAMLFALNAASSAVAVPLALNISTSYGLQATFLAGALLYLLTGLLILALETDRLRLAANTVAVLAIATLLASPWLDRSSSSRESGYSVYALSYGSSTRSRRSMIRGASSRKVPFEWMFWLIQGNGRNILVDTGCIDPQLIKQQRIRGYTPPVERLRQLSLQPEQITDVVLTHAHWDHMGGLAPYTQARVWIQEQEYQRATQELSPSRLRAHGMLWQDLELLLKAETEGRLRRISGEQNLAAGITLVPGGAHTPGSQVVEVEALDGRVILSGDATTLYENIQKQRPIGSTRDPEANLATIQSMLRRAASPFYIIPGHDPKVMEWFPEVAPGIVQITAVPR
ncbi:MAG: MBL fold metallo-hydrolase, partial [Planctomycetota bacterium]